MSKGPTPIGVGPFVYSSYPCTVLHAGRFTRCRLVATLPVLGHRNPRYVTPVMRNLRVDVFLSAPALLVSDACFAMYSIR